MTPPIDLIALHEDWQHPTTLDELGLRYAADKASNFHDYLRRYEPFLAPMRDTAKKVLEIGVAGGNSLRMWADYFPNAVIHGMDISEACLKLNLPAERFQITLADASVPDNWERFEACWGKDFDLICDDGAHTTFAIMQAFCCGFPLLKPGGLFITEDIHGSYLPEYRRDNARANVKHTYTAADFFKDMVDNVNEDGLGQIGRCENREIDIAFIHFSKSLVIVGKR